MNTIERFVGRILAESTSDKPLWNIEKIREGNYPETSGSAMVAYFYIKGTRLGILDKKYSRVTSDTFPLPIRTAHRLSERLLTVPFLDHRFVIFGYVYYLVNMYTL